MANRDVYHGGRRVSRRGKKDALAIELVGGKELQKKLNDVPEHIRRYVLDYAVSKGADVMVAAGRRGAPRLSGKLSRSVEKVRDMDVTDKYRSVYKVAPSVKTRASQRDGFYGRFLEFGTKERTRGANKGRGSLRHGSRAIMVAQTGGSTGRVRATRWLHKSFKRAERHSGVVIKTHLKRYIRTMKLTRGRRGLS